MVIMPARPHCMDPAQLILADKGYWRPSVGQHRGASEGAASLAVLFLHGINGLLSFD